MMSSLSPLVRSAPASARAAARRLVIALGLATATLTSATALAQPATAARPAAAPARPAAAPRPLLAKLPPVTTMQLANGLSAALVTTALLPEVSVQIWYRAGSKDEPRDRRGLAQLVARLMWKGSGRVRPDAHAQLVTALGGRVTGGTDEDSTYFGTDLPSAYLDFALQLEAERMRNLQLRESVVKEERERLASELAQEESSPVARGLRRLLELSFTRHPYAWPSGGSTADLKAVTVADAKRFYDTYYVPGNALVVVVGPVGADALRASLEKHFGALTGGPIARLAKADDEPEITAARREVTAAGPLGLVMTSYAVPAAASPNWAALQVAAALLGGDDGRLKTRLRNGPPKDLGLDGGVTAQPREHPGLFITLAAYRDPGQSATIEAAVLDEIAKLAQRGPSADELARAKAQLVTRAAFALEPASGLASAVGRSWLWYGDASGFAADLDRIDAVKPEDVRRVLGTYLRPERATTLAVPPAAAAKAAKP